MANLEKLLQKFSFYLYYFVYEIFYYLIGSLAIVEDIVYRKRNKCSLQKRTGEVAIVTGGARGIGLSLVKNLLMCDMTVIIGCRKTTAGEVAIDKLRTAGLNSGLAKVIELDLMSLKSVKDFAHKVKSEFEAISLMINNAGIMFPPYIESEDGYESQWQVNYLAPFLLTHLLLPAFEHAGEVSGKNARIVNVTSCAHVVSLPINFDNINKKDYYIPSAVYAQSKLAQILFSMELDNYLKTKQSKVRVLSVHPGIVNTDLFNGTLLKTIFPWLLKYICKDVEEGATSVLYPCLSPTLENVGGVYISNCQLKNPSSLAKDKALQAKLFQHSLNALNIKEFGVAISSN
ncbi:short-chain dehydrogenase TIC 32, chloroplastic-like [Cimex lectularius]|uniref:Dehydrogenase n=1 Tax=Cimex lectularius TaxID=79782 RepID=A0A8I6RHG5_CIMLE|nr:short-chain dehydrogenase TIC 32, chloroplastic-like [Cimex lectularius]